MHTSRIPKLSKSDCDEQYPTISQKARKKLKSIGEMEQGVAMIAAMAEVTHHVGKLPRLTLAQV